MSSATPLVILCVNSIIVGALALVPRTLPPQAGHLFPQPAPDLVARTKAPHSTTATLKHSVAQAKRATPDIFHPFADVAGVGVSNFSMARCIVRFISETTAGTSRW